jgi:hypothetical protein
MNPRTASGWEKQRAKEIAEAILSGQMAILEGARSLCPLAHTDAIADEGDRMLIIAIDSETDYLPVGEVRKYWAEDSLQEKDVYIARAEERYKRDLLDLCERILRQ